MLTRVRAHKPRAQLFGVSKVSSNPFASNNAIPPPPPQQVVPAPASAFGAPKAARADFKGSALFGQAQELQRENLAVGGGGLFGASNNTNNVPLPASLRHRARRAPHGAVSEKVDIEEDEEVLWEGGAGRRAPYDDDGETMLEPVPKLEFQELAMEETGLTTTYDLPRLKTLSPSPTTSKQCVVYITFSSVTFSHTIIAKYKPIAFLKAKLHNGVPAGIMGRESQSGKEDKDWGKATASLKKGGEISWDVSLNAGKSVKLNLEYDVALPTGDTVIQC